MTSRHPTTAIELTAPAVLQRLVTGYQVSQAIYVAVQRRTAYA